MPLSEAVEYCRQQNITDQDTNARDTGRLDKLAKFTGLPMSMLAQALQADIFDFENLHPNKVKGPLSMHNKVRIRDDYPDSKLAVHLAKYLNTTYQNVRIAQRGDFIERGYTGKEPRVPPAPLTIDQKVHIRDNEHDVPTAELAKKYNARYQCVARAQRGDFVENRVTWVTRKITPEQAAMLGLTSTTIKVPQ